ncbi:MAG: alanine dehydrogenase [Bacteroidota bacterium]|nr:alanine dehydrogenase [Bacteroidota bacterium]
MNKKKSFSSFDVLPQEEMLALKPTSKRLKIGVPKESSFQENRVSLTPDSVGLLVNNGHKVVIESNAGLSSSFSDNQYIKEGANITSNKDEVFKTDIILKIEPPTFSELKLMTNNQQLISAIQMNTQEVRYVNNLLKKQITALAFEFIQDRQFKIPIVRSMSEIAGNTSVLIAGEYLNNINKGKGLMLGGISGLTPSKVVILGAGTVGEYASRTAIGLGASVIVFDNSITKLRRLQNNNNHRIETSTIQPKALEKALFGADVVIAALRVGDDRIPCIVSEEMVKNMSAGSVVIDVSIDQGGCFETSEVTSHKNPTFIKHDVVHYCVPNIASRVSRTASMAISNILTPFVLSIGDEGGIIELIKKDKGFRHGVYTFNGMLTNEILAKKFNITFKDLDLIMATI